MARARLLGEISLIDGKPRSATIHAFLMRKLRTLSLTAWKFQPLLEKHPALNHQLLLGLCAHIREAEAREGARGHGYPAPGAGAGNTTTCPVGSVAFGSATLLADDVQLWLVIAAERAGESASVQVDCGEHLATLAHPHAVAVADVGVPDGAARRRGRSRPDGRPACRPHPSVGERAVGGDVVRRQPLA